MDWFYATPRLASATEIIEKSTLTGENAALATMKRSINLQREEWDLLQCPSQEIEACWFYELSREVDWFIPLARRGNLGRFSPSWAAIEAARLARVFTEWPKTPFLKIDPNIRRERLTKLNMGYEDPERLENMFDITRKVLDIGLNEKDGAQLIRQCYHLIAGGCGSDPYAMLLVNLARPYKETRRRFLDWIRKIHTGVARYKMAYRETCRPPGPGNLVAIAAYRLLVKAGLNAREATELVGGKKAYGRYPTSATRWSAAKTKFFRLRDECFPLSLKKQSNLTI